MSFERRRNPALRCKAQPAKIPQWESACTPIALQRERRIDADGFVIVGYRTIEIALEGVDAAAVGECAGRSWIEADRFVEVGSAASNCRFSVRPCPRKQYAAASLLPVSRLASMTALHAATLSSGGVVALMQACQLWSPRSLGRRGRRLRKHHGGTQQCSGQAGQNTHISQSPASQFPVRRRFASPGSCP